MPNLLALLREFEHKPDDALVPEKVGDAILGISKWTRQRRKPLPRYEVIEGVFRNRAGDIRALIRSSRLNQPDSA
jgi:hypothetical protein